MYTITGREPLPSACQKSSWVRTRHGGRHGGEDHRGGADDLLFFGGCDLGLADVTYGEGTKKPKRVTSPVLG